MKFEPFQKVLVRNYGEDEYPWRAALFSHQEDGVFNACGKYWDRCIPYEGNEHLLGTLDNPTEPEFKFGDKVAISYDGKDWQWAIYVRKVDGDMPHEVYMQVPWHYGGQEYHVKFCHHEEW